MTPYNNVNWSNWSLNDLQVCGEKFRRRHIEKERPLKTPSLIRGIAVHDQADVGYKRRMSFDKGLGEEEAQDLASDSYESNWTAGVRIHSDDVKEHGSESGVKAYFKDESVKISGHHAVNFAPKITPIAVEERIEVIPRGFDFKLVAILDLVDQRVLPPNTFGAEKPTEAIIIRDSKTSKKAPKSTDADLSQQLTFQALGWLAKTGKLPDALTLDYFWLTEKRRTNSMKTLSTKRVNEDINALLNRIAQGVEAVQRGVFTPAPPDSWQCSEKYCPYFDDCRYVRKPVQISLVV